MVHQQNEKYKVWEGEEFYFDLVDKEKFIILKTLLLSCCVL
jgi:hypothetical protein